MPTEDAVQPWAIRSTLISVGDLDRSVAFYRELGPFDEIARQDAVAVLGEVSATSIVLILRETLSTHHARHGQQSLGLRSITFNVGSLGELDRIESVLRRHDRFARAAGSRSRAAHRISCADGILTTCPWSLSATRRTNRSVPTTTERLLTWSIHSTPDAAICGRISCGPSVTVVDGGSLRTEVLLAHLGGTRHRWTTPSPCPTFGPMTSFRAGFLVSRSGVAKLGRH